MSTYALVYVSSLIWRMMLRDSFTSWLLAVCCFRLFYLSSESKMPQEEVYALQQIATELGATYWSFNPDSCEVVKVGVSQMPPTGSEGYVECNCKYDNNNHTICHVKKISLRGYNLPGVLPTNILKLPYLRQIDFSFNFLRGTIPKQWALAQLNFISLFVNRLSGQIPKELGNITTLKYLNLEANNFSWHIPPEIGNLINLKTLFLSSNQLVGQLPTSLSKLTELYDFRISDNNLDGPIPDFIQNWRKLGVLEMLASGLEGPIPTNISLQKSLVNLRISDLKGPIQEFPALGSATNLIVLVLRNCNISGAIPEYIWELKLLELLDVSFNRLVGEIPNDIGEKLNNVLLTGNMLSGSIPPAIFKDGSIVDLSYNNFTWQGPGELACGPIMSKQINLFKGVSASNTVHRMFPCSKNVNCPRYQCSLRINCGGANLSVKESNGKKVIYEGDAGNNTATYLSDNYWGFISTGDLMDEPYYQYSRIIRPTTTTNLSELYTTARLSSLSLVYFHSCLGNGSYNVSLHFAEILFTNDATYSSLGRRKFDIYVQEKLVWKDFDIEDEAGGAGRPTIKYFNATVQDNTLEIRFYWAYKGTTLIPSEGDYGSLVSAISVEPYNRVCSDGNEDGTTALIIGVVVTLCVTIFLSGTIYLKICLKGKQNSGKDFEGQELQTIAFSLKQIRDATNNFDEANKVGEGGFGPVYKGVLPDGTVIAVKQLSSGSRQGNREFLNEIGMISCVQHPNLVKLYGGCIEDDELLLVYEYMENNSLAHILFGEDSNKSQLILDWPTTFKICIGIARGLAFLHDESGLRIVHRDIKATNVLLDKDLNPKISDFGLARLNEDERTHISTKVAGTMGYMAPEYAIWGYLTDKADVYSFGVVILEIVSGKSNKNYFPSANFIGLVDWASHLQESDDIDELVDERLGSHVNKDEVERMVKVALLCTNSTPSARPTMSEVVQMIEGNMAIPDPISEGSLCDSDVRFKAMEDVHQKKQSQGSFRNQTENSTTISADVGSSSYAEFHSIARDDAFVA